MPYKQRGGRKRRDRERERERDCREEQTTRDKVRGGRKRDGERRREDMQGGISHINEERGIDKWRVRESGRGRDTRRRGKRGRI